MRPSRAQLMAMMDNSPSHYYSHIKTPALFAIGVNDRRVPPSQVWWVYRLAFMSEFLCLSFFFTIESLSYLDHKFPWQGMDMYNSLKKRGVKVQVRHDDSQCFDECSSRSFLLTNFCKCRCTDTLTHIISTKSHSIPVTIRFLPLLRTICFCRCSYDTCFSPLIP